MAPCNEHQHPVYTNKALNVIEHVPPADDTATTPHERNATIIQFPVELSGSLPEQHEALCIGDNLAGIQGLADVLHKLLLVAAVLGGGWALKHFAGVNTLILKSQTGAK